MTDWVCDNTPIGTTWSACDQVGGIDPPDPPDPSECGFQNAYDPSQWATIEVKDNVVTDTAAFVDVADAPASIDIWGMDDGSGLDGFIAYQINIPASGVMQFSWTTFVDGGQVPGQYLGYSINGNFIEMLPFGTKEISLNVSDVFRWELRTDNYESNPMILTISDFCGP